MSYGSRGSVIVGGIRAEISLEVKKGGFFERMYFEVVCRM